MIVTAVLVSHQGERWLPAILAGVAAQTRPVDRAVAVDTGSTDASPELLSHAWGPGSLVVLDGTAGFGVAVKAGLDHVGPAQNATDEWLWLLHDDANPAPEALAQLLRAAEDHPEARVLGPKIREWPSLRRLLEVGVTISGTGRRETGLERGEYDQGQHDDVRPVLSVNTAGMLVRRDAFEALGGFDPALPVFGTDLDFGWRAARAGHTVLVVPQAVLFHVEAASDGLRRTELTGPHPHRAQRAAELRTVLFNIRSRALLWQTVRFFFGTLLRVLGFLAVRAPRLAADELGALWDVYRSPGILRAGRARRAETAPSEPAARKAETERTTALLAPWWVPYRHGLDFLIGLAQALTSGAADVAERRRAQKVLTATANVPSVNTASPKALGPDSSRMPERDEDEAAYADTGWVARFITNPVAVITALAVLLLVFAARDAFGTVVGGALSPAPGAVADWWGLHIESHHALGTGSEVAAPGYIPLLALLGSVVGGPSAAITVMMVAAMPMAMWGAWRLLRVLGHVVNPEGLPRWVLLWGSLAYALVPATSGAWGQGRFGVVVAAAVMPWLAHAALGFADPDPRRRWRAAWRTGVLLALAAAFVPMIWPVMVALVLVVEVAARIISRSFGADRSVWLPPLAMLGVVPVLLAPWLLPLLFSGAGAGLLLEAGRLPVSDVTTTGLLTGQLEGAGSPLSMGVLLLVLALLALVPRASRVPVLGCWLVALASAVVVAALSFVTLDLGVADSRPGVGLFVVLLQGTFVAAVTLGLGTWFAEGGRGEPGFGMRRIAVAATAAIAVSVPVTGAGWWLLDSESTLTSSRDPVVPAYMVQSSADGVENGVLILSGDVAQGLTYRIRRDDGITVGEDEILALTPEDSSFTRVVSELTSRPTPEMTDELAASGVQYVVMTAPVDARIASTLDATDGLLPASAEDRTTRAWKVDKPLAAKGLDDSTSWPRTLLLAIQLLAVLVLLVMCGPDLAPRREREGEA